MKLFCNLHPALTLLFAIAPLVALTNSAVTAAHHSKYIFFVGTYTEDAYKGKGIYAYAYDADTGHVAPLGLAAETSNPSWIAFHPNRRFLYATNEVGNFKGPNSGGLSAFSIDRNKDGLPTGKLTFLNEVSTRGAGTCYVTIDRTGKYALVANYDGGSVAVFPIRENGSLGDASAFVQHAGHGADPDRQAAPHAHSINLSPDNRFAMVDDLGLDQLLVYKFDNTKGLLTPNEPSQAKLDAGSGPRHFALHPSGKFAYVVSEMKGTVTVFSNDARAGTLHALQTISTLPENFKGNIEDAEIAVHPSGKFLYVSNRGDSNSIAIFTIDAEKGTLTLVESTSTQGKNPRSFEIDPTGALLFVANQDSNNIVMFRIDQNGGFLTKAGHLSPIGPALDVPSPVCIKFLKIGE
jgi:6-phosphogluconolactonase